MKRQLCIVSLLCLVSLIMSGFESEGQDIEYLMKMGNYRVFQDPVFLQKSDQTDLLKAINAEQKGRKPPLKAGRLTGELLAGFGGQMIGVMAGIGFAALILPDGPIFLVGPIAGGALGSSAGVYWVGTSFSDQVGSYWAAVGGNILFTGAFILCEYAGFIPDYAPVRMVGYFILPTVASMIGFNMTRRYKTSATALINVNDGQMNLATPPIYLNLVKVRF